MLSCCPTPSCGRSRWLRSKPPAQGGRIHFHDPFGHGDDDAFARAPYIEGGTHGRDRRIPDLHGEWPRRILRDSKESFAALERHLARIATQRRPKHRAGAHTDDGPVVQRHVAILAGRVSTIVTTGGSNCIERMTESDRRRESHDDTCGQAGRQPGGDAKPPRPYRGAWCDSQ